MAYDPAANNIVLFGGFDGTSYLNDTWIFNGTDWMQIDTADAPPVRSAAGMTFDRTMQKMVLFGGYNGNQYLGDTWIWDGVSQTWTQATPQTQPTPVTLPMMFMDPVSFRAEMIGGFDGNFYQNTTWKWTGSDWSVVYTRTIFAARGAAAVGNDYANKTVVIFGGLADVNPVNTWTWNGHDWTEQNPTTQPLWTYYSGTSYDPHLAGVINFGGGSGANTTWAWQGNNWRDISAQNPPPPTDSQGMAYDFGIDQMIMFGGESAGNFLSDTYSMQIQ